MNKEAIKELILKMADDALIIGHRNSEWTGIGPTLEEDIAFSSMAQDKIGHAFQLYTILHEELGEEEPDQLAFKRNELDFKCCHFVELPIGEYDFSLVRHFLLDYAEAMRYESLATSSYEPLAQLAKKIKGEVRYHIMHADTWFQQLAVGSEESKARLQQSLDYAFPYALGIFEEGTHERELIDLGVFIGENELREKWLDKVLWLIEKAGLKTPDYINLLPINGGRGGYHTEHLQSLLDEMGEVFRLDIEAAW